MGGGGLRSIVRLSFKEFHENSRPNSKCVHGKIESFVFYDITINCSFSTANNVIFPQFMIYLFSMHKMFTNFHHIEYFQCFQFNFKWRHFEF